jgi:hypothetical protein
VAVGRSSYFRSERDAAKKLAGNAAPEVVVVAAQQ